MDLRACLEEVDVWGRRGEGEEETGFFEGFAECGMQGGGVVGGEDAAGEDVHGGEGERGCALEEEDTV